MPKRYLSVLPTAPTNPTYDQLTISTDDDSVIESINLRITDAVGRICYTKTDALIANPLTINLAALPAGRYSIHIMGDGVNTVKTIVKL